MTATDANSGTALAVDPGAVSVTVQSPASLTADLTGSAAPAPGGTVTLTLTLTNLGGAAAHVTGVTPTVAAPNDAGVTCPAQPDEPLPPSLTGSVSLHWTCTSSASAGVGSSSTLGATVEAADANTSAALSAPVTGWLVTVGP